MIVSSGATLLLFILRFPNRRITMVNPIIVLWILYFDIRFPESPFRMKSTQKRGFAASWLILMYVEACIFDDGHLNNVFDRVYPKAIGWEWMFQIFVRREAGLYGRESSRSELANDKSPCNFPSPLFGQRTRETQQVSHFHYFTK